LQRFEGLPTKKIGLYTKMLFKNHYNHDFMLKGFLCLEKNKNHKKT
jgi:hypothetical protein